MFNFTIMPQPVDKMVQAISNNTLETALHTEKGFYEYIAIGISLLAFLTAIITLYYSIKTYRSQKQTEENTNPTITKQNQLEILYCIVDKIIDNIPKSIAIVVRLSLSDNKAYVYDGDIISQRIPLADFHLEPFYGTNKDFSQVNFIERSKFGKLSELKEALSQYNENLERINLILKDKRFSLSFKKDFFVSSVLKKQIKLLYEIVDTVDNVFRDEFDIDIRDEIVKYPHLKGLLLTCRDANTGLKAEHIKDEYLDIINDCIANLDFEGLLEGYSFSSKDEEEPWKCLALETLYYLSDVNSNFKILMIPYE